jgi:hypothetical protein
MKLEAALELVGEVGIHSSHRIQLEVIVLADSLIPALNPCQSLLLCQRL